MKVLDFPYGIKLYMRHGLKGIFLDQCANHALAVYLQRPPKLVQLGYAGDSENTCASLILFLGTMRHSWLLVMVLNAQAL